LATFLDVVTTGDDGTLLAYWVPLAGLTTLKDSVTTGDDGILLPLDNVKIGNLKRKNRDHKKYLNEMKILVTCKFYYI